MGQTLAAVSQGHVILEVQPLHVAVCLYISKFCLNLSCCIIAHQMGKEEYQAAGGCEEGNVITCNLWEFLVLKGAPWI